MEIAVLSGGSGFLGQHLATALELKGIKVINLPRAMLYLPDENTLKLYLKEINPTYILAFHAYGNHGKQTEEDPIIMANYFATWNLLKASRDINYKAFINCSTSSIYGHKNFAMKETDYLTPDTFYATSKAGAMYLGRAYAKSYDKPVVSVIPFSIFGEGEADWRFIPVACKHLVNGTTMPLSGNRYQTHDWTYVKDFVSGVLTVLENAEELKGEWVNIGTGVASTNLEITAILEKITGKKLKYEFSWIEQPHHSNLWYADNSKLKSLGWSQEFTLEEALKNTWKYYEQRYNLE